MVWRWWGGGGGGLVEHGLLHAKYIVSTCLVEHRLRAVGLQELGGVALLELGRREEGRVLAQALAHGELDLVCSEGRGGSVSIAPSPWRH